VTSSANQTLVVETAPSITSLSTTSGAVGAQVVITGTGFGSADNTLAVTFNGIPATVAGSWTTTQVSVNVPTGDPVGAGNVVVSVNGVASQPASFTVLPTPVITSLSVTSGVAGSTLTITGQNFGSTQGAGYVEATLVCFPSVTSWSSTTVNVTMCGGQDSGLESIYVSAAGVLSNPVSYTILPSITGLSPSSGPVGTAVFITGSALCPVSGTLSVTFNGVPITVTPTCANYGGYDGITATVPTGATSGNIVVTGGGLVSNPVPFTVN
jgi:hypothetical protein